MHPPRTTPAIHLPAPSIWPFAVGLSVLLVSFGLVWWSTDRSNTLSGVLLGTGAGAVIASVAGWGWEDSRMRRLTARAEEGERVEQVLAFVVRPAHPLAAVLLDEIDRLGSDLRGHGGLLDLRILRSEKAGMAQMLVESTWASREALEAAEATDQTFLDLVVEYGDAVEPGSVQVTDVAIEVDTKDVSPRSRSPVLQCSWDPLCWAARPSAWVSRCSSPRAFPPARRRGVRPPQVRAPSRARSWRSR